MSRPDFRHAMWHKSSRSGGNGDCVEVAHADARVGLRDSKDPTGPMLAFAPTGWAALLAGVRRGDFSRH